MATKKAPKAKKTTVRRPLAPGAGDPRSKQRRPRAAAAAHLVALRRCPACHADLAHLVPVPESAVKVSELVARRTLLGAPTTSDDLVRLLSPASGPAVNRSRVGNWLRHAVANGLLTRERATLPTGGYRYTYKMREAAVAYLFDASVARQLQDLFAQARARVAGVSAGNSLAGSPATHRRVG